MDLPTNLFNKFMRLGTSEKEGTKSMHSKMFQGNGLVQRVTSLKNLSP